MNSIELKQPELKQPFTLPCGVVVPNRLCKAAMTEGVANSKLQATQRHATLYKRWAEGGAGILITGNVLIDRNILERPAMSPTNPLALLLFNWNCWATTPHPEPCARMKFWT